MGGRQDFRVIYATPRYEETVGFYRDVLELPIVTSWSLDVPGTVFQAGAGTLEVLAAPLGGDLGTPSGFRLLLRVDNLDGWHAQLRAKGIELAQELVDRPWGYRELAVVDPNGIRVYLYAVFDADLAGHA